MQIEDIQEMTDEAVSFAASENEQSDTKLIVFVISMLGELVKDVKRIADASEALRDFMSEDAK